MQLNLYQFMHKSEQIWNELEAKKAVAITREKVKYLILVEKKYSVFDKLRKLNLADLHTKKTYLNLF